MPCGVDTISGIPADALTWGDVLANGQFSEGTDPVLTAGDTIYGEDSTTGAGGDLPLVSGATTAAGFSSGDITFTIGATGANNNAGIFRFTGAAGGNSTTGNAGNGSPLTMVLGVGGTTTNAGSNGGNGGGMTVTMGAGGDGAGVGVGGVGGSLIWLCGAGGDGGTAGVGGAIAFQAGAAGTGGAVAGGAIGFTTGAGSTAAGTGGDFTIVMGAAGTGGDSGDFTFTGANGGNSTTGDGGDAGNAIWTFGDGGTTTNSGSDGGVGGGFRVAAGDGGAGSDAGDGGAGGEITMTTGAAGTGGVGHGGDMTLQTGAGSDTAPTGTGAGGRGGDMLIETGDGGDSATGNAGDGGDITIRSGQGGVASVVNSSAGGDGGTISIIARDGGAGSTDGGPGGNIIITAGDGGAGGATGIGGSITMTAGATGGAGADGDIVMIVDAGTTTYDGDTGLWTYPASATYSSASPVLTIGDGTGLPAIALNKANADTAGVGFQNVGVLRWLLVIQADEDFAISRYDNTGAWVDNTLISQATGLWTYPASATYSSASPTVQIGDGTGAALLNVLGTNPVVTVGSGTGSPSIVIEKLETGTATIRFANDDDDYWDVQMNATEGFVLNRFLAGVYQDSTIVVQATHEWRYPGSAFYNSASPNIQLGSGAGAPFFTLNQSADEAGFVEIENASTPIGYIYFGTGVPAGAAANGSFYFRMHNAGAGSAIYKRTGGAWVAIA